MRHQLGRMSASKTSAEKQGPKRKGRSSFLKSTRKWPWKRNWKTVTLTSLYSGHSDVRRKTIQKMYYIPVHKFGDKFLIICKSDGNRYEMLICCGFPKDEIEPLTCTKWLQLLELLECLFYHHGLKDQHILVSFNFNVILLCYEIMHRHKHCISLGELM